jgi:hypothetical protein
MDRASASLVLSMLIGTVGFALLVYGKKQSRLPHALAGIAMVAYPYFIDSPWVMGGIASALALALALAIRAGR